jgi:uncharacterized alpha-E superfamily protein
VGTVSVAALAELMLFDATNPRSLVYQLERLRTDLGELPGSSGSSRPERMVAEVSTLLRRSDPAALEAVSAAGRRAALADLLTAAHTALRELTEVIAATQLALPGELQPLWGPDARRVMP